MNIYLNGAPTMVADDCRLTDLIDRLELSGRRFAIEINEELVPRSQFADHRLSADDQIEIIQAVGGG